MAHPVFISYSRTASAAEAQTLADTLGDLAFLDSEAIEDGDDFPARLCEELLGARVVVLFATRTYADRRFCRAELRLALAAGDAESSHLVIALGDGAECVLDELPPGVAGRSWPAAEETERLAQLVKQHLNVCGAPLSDTLAKEDAQRIATAFLEESRIPEPLDLHGIPCSLPPGIARQSIGGRFVGRASDLRELHRILFDGGMGRAARLTSRIAAGAGFGKTRIAIEYLHRYGPRYYPGGLFWVNAASGSLDDEFWRVLSELDAAVPSLTVMRQHGRFVQRELERALRRIERPALFIVDNIPEAAPGGNPDAIAEFCPAVGAVTVVATSRQDTHEPGVRGFRVDPLPRDAAILLLTENIVGWGRFSWERWGRAAEWVGDLPIALDLLNRCLAVGSITAEELMERTEAIVTTSASPRTTQLDQWRDALRGQVPDGAVFGITEAFDISFEKLDRRSQRLAVLLAQYGPAPIPDELVAALGEEVCGAAERTALRSRHFVTAAEEGSFGVMHRLMADFLRIRAGEASDELVDAACVAVLRLMTPRKCQDPHEWKALNRVRPHAEALFQQVEVHPRVVVKVSEAGLRVGNLARAQGDLSGSVQLLRQVVEVRKRVLGLEDVSTLTSMNDLAETLRTQGDLGGAQGLHEQVLEVRARLLGEEHAATLTSMGNLGTTLLQLGDHAGARRLHERVLEVRGRLLGEEHPDTLTSMNNLAEALYAQGDRAGVRRLHERIVEVRRRVLGEEHPDTLTSMNNLGATLDAQGDLAEARRIEEWVLQARTRVQGQDHPDTLQSMFNLAFTLRHQGEHCDSVRLLRRCLAGFKRTLGDEHPNTRRAAALLRSLGLEPDGAGAE